tara:strand:+ start:2557 stop:2862 length:306 start_codon:yes stop_codon:yes gene_type:complete
MKKVNLLILSIAFVVFGFSQGIEKNEVTLEADETIKLDPIKVDQAGTKINVSPSIIKLNTDKIEHKELILKMKEDSKKLIHSTESEKKAAQLKSDETSTED